MANPNRTRRDRKSYTFTMTTTDVVWSCVGAVFALTVFFLFGVLVGRGYLPTEPDAGQAGSLQVEQSTHGQLTGGDMDGQAQDQAEQAKPEVLKAEELAYQDELDKPSESGVVEEAQEAQANAEKGAESVADKAADAAQDAKKVAQEEAQAVETGKYDPDNLPAPEPGEKVYAYTYQAAAFKDEQAAINLASKLKEKGLPAVVSKGVTTSATWYRVQIPFTGTPSQTRPLRDAVKDVTGQKPVMVSKKAQ